MTVLLIAGSPSERSRSSALLDAAERYLTQTGVYAERLRIRDLSPQALLLADFGHPSVVAATRQVAQAKAIVIATPVYKAAYAGSLKVLLDLLPQTAFQGKTVLPLATAGSPSHMLALDYALRPVLQALGSRQILPGVYATDAQINVLAEGGAHVEGDLQRRLHDGLDNLVAESRVSRHSPSAKGLFEAIPFAQVRCSV